MKKIIAVLLIMSFIMVIVYGCSFKAKDSKELSAYFAGIKTYSANIQIEIYNDKQKLNYTGVQFHVKGIGNRLELNKERIAIYKQDKTYFQDLKNGQRYALNNEAMSMYNISFVDEFVKYLYTEGEKDIVYKEVQGLEYEIITISMLNNNRDIKKAVLYINLKEKAPRLMAFYDANGNEKVMIKYRAFNCKAKVDSKLFNTD